jgi:hypothetical protein
LTKSFNSVANDAAVTAATVRPGHGYPADRIEVSPEPTGWQGSGADNEVKQGATTTGLVSAASTSGRAAGKSE